MFIKKSLKAFYQLFRLIMLDDFMKSNFIFKQYKFHYIPTTQSKVKGSILLALNLSPLGAGLENDVEFINPDVRGLMLSRRTGDEKLSCGCGST